MVKKTGQRGGKKKIMMEIVATYIVPSQMPVNCDQLNYRPFLPKKGYFQYKQSFIHTFLFSKFATHKKILMAWSIFSCDEQLKK